MPIKRADLEEAAFWDQWICPTCGTTADYQPDDSVCELCEARVYCAKELIAALGEIEGEEE